MKCSFCSSSWGDCITWFCFPTINFEVYLPECNRLLESINWQAKMSYGSDLYPLLIFHVMERTAPKLELKHSAESAPPRWCKVTCTEGLPPTCTPPDPRRVLTTVPGVRSLLLLLPPAEGLHPITSVSTLFLHYPCHLQGVAHSDPHAQSHPSHTLFVISKLSGFLLEMYTGGCECFAYICIDHVCIWSLSEACGVTRF